MVGERLGLDAKEPTTPLLSVEGSSARSIASTAGDRDSVATGTGSKTSANRTNTGASAVKSRKNSRIIERPA